MAKSLDEEVAAFRSRPLDSGPYPYLWLDALAVREREGGRIVRFRLRRGQRRERRGLPRDPQGLDTFTSEDEAAWRVFLAGLVERGLSGVQLVVSDDHRGLRQGDRRPAARRRLAALPNALHAQPADPRAEEARKPFVATTVRTIFA